MGGKGGGGASDDANKMLAEQIAMQKRSEAQKMKALSEQQFNIIKSQGTMNWNSSAPSGITPDDEIK